MMRKVRAALLVVLFIFLQPMCSQPAEPTPAEEFVLPAASIPPEYLGVHYVAAWASPAPWPAAAGIYRLHGATPRWHMIHTGPNQWYDDPDGKGLSRIESVLHFRDLHAPDAKVVYVIGGGGEAWSGSEWVNGTHSGFPDWVHAGNIKSAWREHVRFMASRFRFDYWEIWNEPDSRAWYGGSMRLLADLTVIAAEEIRAADPDAKIIGPSFTQDGHDTMREFYYLLPVGAVDIVGWHHGITNPEADTVRIREAKEIAQGLPLWATEINVKGGASELMRAYLIHWLYGVEMVAYYSWEMPTYGPPWDVGYAHTTDASGTITEVGEAYLQLADWLVGRRVVAFEPWRIELDNGVVIKWEEGIAHRPPLYR